MGGALEDLRQRWAEEAAERAEQEAEESRLDALDRRDRDGEKTAADALFGGVPASAPSCNGKRDYASIAQAKRALRRLQTLIAGTSVRRTYRCPNCGEWHLTSDPEPTRRRA
jgi:hypothetical protein